MRFGMAHALMILAERVLTAMFFTGLAGCASVVVISWVSIFKDGFSDPKNKYIESHWDASHASVPVSVHREAHQRY